MKILVAVDGSPHTRRMLDHLAAHDAWLGPQHRYTVICGVMALPKGAAAFLERQMVDDYYHSEAQAVLAPIRAFFEQHRLHAEFMHRVGQPAEQIARLADEGGFDLLMMGSHGRGLLGNLVLGSVVTKVLARCRTPVLLVR